MVLVIFLIQYVKELKRNSIHLLWEFINNLFSYS